MQCACGLEFSTEFKLDLHKDHCDSWKSDGLPDPDGTQTCKLCLIRKSLFLFDRHPNRKCGFSAKCKECIHSRNTSYRIINKDEITKINKNYYEKNRDSLLEQKNKHYHLNSVSILEKKRKYTKLHSESRKSYIKNYRLEHKDELRAKSFIIRAFIVNAVLDFFGSECENCGVTEREFLTIDHRNNDGRDERHLGSIGWKRNIIKGKSDLSKYCVLCHNCNLSRYRKNPVHHVKNRSEHGIPKICYTCKEEKDVTHFANHKGHPNFECKLCVNFRKTAIRRKCFALFDSICSCCLNSDEYSLSIDHIKLDGSARRSLGERSGVDIYRKIVNGSVPLHDFRLLCFNCNYSASKGNGICYHKRDSFATPFVATSLIGKSIRPHETLPLEDFKFSNISISECYVDQAKVFLDKYHYAGFGRGHHSLFGAYVGDELICVMKIASVIRIEAATSLGYRTEDILELDRFCIHPARHKRNLATYFMVRAIKLFKIKYPDIAGLISFADPRFGHTGSIYKAANWKMIGLTHSSYFYSDSSGGEIHKKTVYNAARSRKMKERSYAESVGLKKIMTPPKIKYLFKL